MFKTIFVLSAIPVSSVALGVATDTLSSQTHITIGEALACTSVVVCGAYYLGQKFKSMSVMHTENVRRFRKIESAVDKLMAKAGIDFSISEEETEDK